MSILGTRAELVYDLNLLLQILIILVLFSGAYFAKMKANYRIHGKTMTSAIVLNAISIMLVMGPRLVDSLGFLTSTITELRTQVAVLHATLGVTAEILGIAAVLVLSPCGSKMGTNVKYLMRTTFAIWALAFLLGASVYLAFYVL